MVLILIMGIISWDLTRLPQHVEWSSGRNTLFLGVGLGWGQNSDRFGRRIYYMSAYCVKFMSQWLQWGNMLQ